MSVPLSGFVKILSTLPNQLKLKNYSIILLLCGSSNENRQNAIVECEEKRGFVENAEEDFNQKEQSFFENFPLYVRYADEIYLFWTDDFKKGAYQIETFSKQDSLSIQNAAGLEKFKKSYELFRALPSFHSLQPFEELFRRK